ncbi:MAG TPA: hypothetical protein VK550_24285 [Polyangiaceae bacterium]|nr:hypothetical protein [Polyangiaceae bacterium]
MRWTRAILLGAGLVPLAATAGAAPPPFVRMVGEEAACPTPAQVVTVLRRLLPKTKVTAETGTVAPGDAAITDEGSQYRVTIAGQERSFVDGARQCAERAKHAAVFVALVLDPPTVPEPPETSPTPPSSAPPAPLPAERPAAPSPERLTFPPIDVSLEAVFQVAPTAGERRTAVAAGLMGWARAKRGFHLALGAGVLRGSFHFDGAAADAWWIPLHVAAGVSFQADRWEGGGELGPNVTVLSVLGRDLEQAETQVRLEWGARAAAFSRFWFSKNFALYVSAETLVRPSSYALLIDPQGRVGLTPVLWLGGAAGLSCKLE